MNCPLCNQLLLEITSDEYDDIDFICSQRTVAGTKENIPYTVSHFEYRSGDNYYIVRVPPYRLHVFNTGTNIYQDINGLGTAYKDIMSLKSITKDNLSTFNKNYNELSVRIKKLILFL